MVVGIDKFREHFTGHEDEHAIIGSGACDLWFNATGLEFRDTKDIDMVLPVDVAFGDAFQASLDADGYQTLCTAERRRSSVSSRKSAVCACLLRSSAR